MQQYAILILKNMQVKFSNNQDDLKQQMDSLNRRRIPFEVYKYNAGAELYARQEKYEL